MLSTVYAADLLAMFDKALILPSIISCCRKMQVDNLVGDNLLKSKDFFNNEAVINSFLSKSIKNSVFQV